MPGYCADKMTVLYDYQIFIEQKWGGISRYHYEIAQQFWKNNDIKCLLPVLFPRNTYLKGKAADNKKYSFKYAKLLNNLYTYLICIVKKVDVIHPTWYFDYILKLKLFKNRKLVITIHDMIQEIYPEDFPAEVINQKKEYIYAADKIIADSNNTKKDILRIYPDINPDKIEVVYLGVNVSKERHIVENLPDKYILYVGNRAIYKNFRFFIKGVKPFVTKNHIPIVCVGGGEFTEDEIDFLNDMGVYNLTKQYALSDSQLNYAYSNALCFVYPSLYEGFGLPILEAMANGCPCVISNSSSLPEVAGEAAVYFDPTDENDLCRRIEQIYYDDVLRKNLIASGREQVKLFSWEKTAQELERVYKKLKTI